MDNQELETKLQEVLDKTHDNPQKMVIKKSKAGFNFACPVCGDSDTQTAKKRAHILTDKAEPYFYCHHECGPMDLHKFFSHFGITPPKEDIFTFFDAPVKVKSSYKYNPKEMALLEIGRLAVPIDTVEKTYRLLRIDESMSCWDYVCSRNLQDHLEYLRYWPERNRLVVLNTLNPPEPEMCWDESGYYPVTKCDVIGFQARALGPDNIKYLTYSLEKICGESGLGYRPKPGCEDYVKSLGNTYYSTHVDWDQDVYILEGPLDSLFVKNSIALTGSTKRHKGLDSNPRCLYLFDNDKAGKSKQNEKRTYYKKPIFNWNGLCKTIGVEVKDWNDVVNHCITSNSTIPQIKDYFI